MRDLPRLEIADGRVTHLGITGRATTIALGDHAEVFPDIAEFPFLPLRFLPLPPGRTWRSIGLSDFIVTPGDEVAILSRVRHAAGERPAPSAEQMKHLGRRRRIERFGACAGVILLVLGLAGLQWAGLSKI